MADRAKAHSRGDPYSKRNETCKPEEHGQGLETQNDKSVMCCTAAEAHWHDDQVNENEERPDCIEYQEVGFARRTSVVGARPPARNWMLVSLDMLQSLFARTHHSLLCQVQ